MDPRLVYDVGSFNGDDAAYYLHLGYHVVAIEADPWLAGTLRVRFAAEIESGSCHVLNVGIADSDGKRAFYLCEDMPVWNSLDPSMASRDGRRFRRTDILCRTFESVVQEYGIPYFLKVDIEGMDHVCILSLGAGDLPVYVSFEAADNTLDLVRHLDCLGYDRFRLVNQRNWTPVLIPEPGSLSHVIWSVRQWLRLTLRRCPAVHSTLRFMRKAVFKLSARARILTTARSAEPQQWKFPPGSSGPMPAEDDEGWMELPEFLSTYVSVKSSGIIDSAWFDVHAAYRAPPGANRSTRTMARSVASSNKVPKSAWGHDRPTEVLPMNVRSAAYGGRMSELFRDPTAPDFMRRYLAT